jgi:murein L,D-transpeptidase YafK
MLRRNGILKDFLLMAGVVVTFSYSLKSVPADSTDTLIPNIEATLQAFSDSKVLAGEGDKINYSEWDKIEINANWLSFQRKNQGLSEAIDATQKFESLQKFEATESINSTKSVITDSSQDLDLLIANYMQSNNPEYFNRKLLVDKSDRKLYVILNDTVIKEYDVALGIYDQDLNADGFYDYAKGDKEVRGDRKTPEGTFYVSWKHENGSFSPGGHSLVINYPNSKDAKRGLDSGLINEEIYRNILSQEAQCQPTQMRTKLGDSIVIHGGGSSQDWTWGCIALEDEEMAELYDFSTQMTAGKYDKTVQPCGTMVEIRE